MVKKKNDIVEKENIKKKQNQQVEKPNLWVRFRIFCHGVKSEAKKVHWPNRKDMVKYSVATIVFVLFCSMFFYLIDILYAFIQSALS